jgi:hypothetical protein
LVTAGRHREADGRFFSHEWAAADDPESQQVVERYAQILRGYPLPARIPVMRFVQSFDLRGALLDGFFVDEGARTVAMSIYSGDRRSEHNLLKILHEDASVEAGDRQIFESVLVSKGPQIRYDEFDFGLGLDGQECCRHRYLFWPVHQGEGAIEFSRISWALRPVQERPRDAERRI